MRKENEKPIGSDSIIAAGCLINWLAAMAAMTAAGGFAGLVIGFWSTSAFFLGWAWFCEFEDARRKAGILAGLVMSSALWWYVFVASSVMTRPDPLSGLVLVVVPVFTLSLLFLPLAPALVLKPMRNRYQSSHERPIVWNRVNVSTAKD